LAQALWVPPAVFGGNLTFAFISACQQVLTMAARLAALLVFWALGLNAAGEQAVALPQQGSDCLVGEASDGSLSCREEQVEQAEEQLAAAMRTELLQHDLMRVRKTSTKEAPAAAPTATPTLASVAFSPPASQANLSDVTAPVQTAPAAAAVVVLEADANTTAHGNKSSCSTWTGATCVINDCSASRGATTCSYGRCVCIDGFCADGGVCKWDMASAMSSYGSGGSGSASSWMPKEASSWMPQQTSSSSSGTSCETSLGSLATCVVNDCDASRGPTTCSMGWCYCKDGYCNKNGKCEYNYMQYMGSLGAMWR